VGALIKKQETTRPSIQKIENVLQKY